MYSIKITGVTRFNHIAGNTDYQDVAFEIIETSDDGHEGVAASFRHSFPLGMSKKEIQSELKKVLTAFTHEREVAAEAARSKDEIINAERVANELSGTTISL